MALVGYARVSTDGQTLDGQIAALRAAGCEKVLKEKMSGVRADRVQLSQFIASLNEGGWSASRPACRWRQAKSSGANSSTAAMALRP